MSETKWMALLGCTSCLLACVGTRTGNPYDKAPEYDSSSRFAPDNNVGGGGTDGGIGGPQPPYVTRGGATLAALFEHYVALAVSGRGVLVVDVVDPKKPTLVSELPIDGAIQQLHAEPDGVTVAVYEHTSLDSSEIPEQSVPEQVQRLVRVDLSDPQHPRRAFEVDLEGWFWQLDVRGSDYYVLEAIDGSERSVCDAGGGLLGGEFERFVGTMQVVRYTASASGFDAHETIELPTDVGGALSTGDAYFVVDGFQSDAPTLGWVDLASGVTVRGEPFDPGGRPQAVDREGNLLALLLQQPDGSMTFALFELEAGVAHARGRLSLGVRRGPPIAVTLLPSGGAIVDGDGDPVLLLDLSNLDVPRMASQLPADVMRLVEAPTGLLGLGSTGGPDSSGDLIVSSWDASDLAQPMRLASATTDWFYPYTDPGAERWTLDADHDLLLVPFERPEGTQPSMGRAVTREGLGVFELGAMGVTLHSEQASQTELWRPWTDGTSVFGLSYEGFEVLPLVKDAREAEPVSALLPLGAPGAAEPIDRIEVDGTPVVLRERESDGVFYVEVGGDAQTTLELPHRGDVLARVGDRVAVLGLRGVAAECELFEQQGVDPSQIPEIVGPDRGYDPCGPARARGFSVLALDGEPRIVKSLALRSTDDIELMDGVDVRAELEGYVQLADGRILVLASRMQQCNSHEACDRLGVPAYESMGTPGCSSEQDCSDLPSVITFVNGFKNTLAVYALTGVEGASPRLQLGATLDGRFELFDEGPLELTRKLLSTDGGLAFSREDPLYDAEGNSIYDEHEDAIVRYYLDRVAFHDDGSLEALAPINTPGRPIAYAGGDVYSIEPQRDGDEIGVVLHRSGIHGEGAFIESSVELGTCFLASHVQDGHAYVLRYPGDPCVPGASTELLAVALDLEGELEHGEALELPGVTWRFPSPWDALEPEASTLWLAGGPRRDGRLALDLDDPAQPSVRRYLSAPR